MTATRLAPGPGAPATAAEPRPGAGSPTDTGTAPEPERHPRAAGELVGGVMTVAALGVCMFALYAFLVSDLVQARAQRLLAGELKEVLRAAVPGTSAEGSGSGEGSGLLGGADARRRAEPVPPLRPGSPVALLRIPRLGVEQVVVEGTTNNQLRAGPGHFRGTPLPGEPGNAAIAGRRSTFGSPFADLGRLRRGDRIEVVTRGGRFTYRVTEPARRLGRGAADPLQNSVEDRLTLVTSTPWGLARDPLIVRAELRGTPVVPAPGRTLGAPGPAESGFAMAGGAGYAVFFWALVVAGVGYVTARLYRRARTTIVWLLTTPVLLAALLRLFETMTGLFPATW